MLERTKGRGEDEENTALMTNCKRTVPHSNRKPDIIRSDATGTAHGSASHDLTVGVQSAFFPLQPPPLGAAE